MSFSQKLINWYSIYKRDLPWRETKDPYHIWLSEIILQQTQVKQGLPYYNAFIKKYPSIFNLAKASEEAVLKLWQGLGYYSRARNLHYTAKYISNELNGKFPNTYKELIKLKGIGDYTASAIASIAFNEVEAVVDGNVYRLLSRYFGIETPINSTKGIKEFKQLASELIDKKDPANFNQAIMEFGARQCRPKNPDCITCPLNDGCKAFQNKLIEVLPVKLKKTKIKTKYFNFLVIIDGNNNTVFEKRTKKGIWQNLYQFPLVETSKSIKSSGFNSIVKENSILQNIKYEISLYNEDDIIHKLSHQHIYTKFWIIETSQLLQNTLSIDQIEIYPTSVLISNFIEKFDFPYQ